MKTFRVAVAVAVVLTFICVQESSATVSEVEELEEAAMMDNPAVEYQETPVDSRMMPHNRQKRGIECRFCCQNGMCGVCCSF
ncbi:hepcidin-like [Echeneis naucrates]|uniref:hepcidin-like n=1 Tax=Echeneis naucrates TaxID=173247 RepID=UPI0011136E75|nr:hepcidin-like [Echeneis naucrates]